jgi:carbamoyl-phosphate synthase large subunit
MIKNDELQFIINTTEGKKAIADSFTIRRQALQQQVTYTTTISGARATCSALNELDAGDVNRLQDLHRELGKV